MSHFTVGVIVRSPDDLEDALAPYNEADENYMEKELIYTKDEYINEYRRTHPDEDIADEAIWEKAKEEYEEQVEGNNIYGYYNPRARWDWWSIGGRWRYALKTLKSAESIKDQDLYNDIPKHQKGKHRWVDGAKIKDIKWTDMNRPTKEELKQLSRFWDVVVEGKPKKEDEDFGFSYNREYYLERYGTKEEYIMKSSTFYTHDLLNGVKDEWYSMGDMGWFGMDNSTKESINEYLQTFYDIIYNPDYQDYWFILVDCHI